MKLQIKLFGGPVLVGGDGDVIRFPTRKSEALFAYLVERADEEVSRDLVSDLLWPYSGPDQARASLRQEMSVLRKTLGSDHARLIQSHGGRIEFHSKDIEVDVQRFSACCSGPRSIAQQMEGLELYSAPFLESFRIRSQSFTDWVWTTRQALEAKALKLGCDALEKSTAEGHAENITASAQHLCRIDPTYEPAHRALVELHLQAGDTHLAKRQLDLCRQMLKAHLDADISDQTRDLEDRINAAAADRGRSSTTRAKRAAPKQQPRQRRHVIAMSVLAEIDTTDPEDFEQAASDFSALASRIAEERGGMQLNAFNDRVLMCFGYPTAHDRQADTAVGTALDILEATPAAIPGVVTCRIGLASGTVMVSGTGPDVTVTGAVLRDAETISRAASPREILLEQALGAALSTAIRLEKRDDVPDTLCAVQGRVTAEAPSDGFFPARKHRMIGRDAPFAHALELLDRAETARGRAAAVLGQPGEGKSRLVQEVIEIAQHRGFEIRFFQGIANERQATLAPVINQIVRAGALNNDADCALSEALDSWLASIDTKLLAASDYFRSLVDTAKGPSSDASRVPNEVKQRVLDYFVFQVRNADRDRPLLLVFEDAQWFDATTSEAIGRMIEAIEGTAAGVLLVARVDDAPEILNSPLVQKIALAPLDPPSARALLQGLMNGARIREDEMRHVLERAEGNPLIIEEYAEALGRHAPGSHARESHALRRISGDRASVFEPSPASSGQIIAPPDRLLPLLLSRIDSIPGALQVLQHASVFGRRFTLGHLTRIMHPVAVRLPLFRELEAAGIVFAARHGDEAAYTFKHGLVAEAIYSTIPRRDLKVLHERAAQVLLSDTSRSHEADAARHFKAAEAYDEAAHYLEMSGDRAARVAAQSEAIGEYSEALAMVGHLAFSNNRLRRELSLNRKIAAQIIGLRGIPTSEAAPYYTTAQELSQELGDREEALNAAWGLWSIYLMVAKLDTCLEIAETLRSEERAHPTPTSRLIVDYMLGVTHAYRGTLRQARQHLESVRNINVDTMNEELRVRFGMDIGLTADSFLSWVYALLDAPEEADLASQRALKCAKIDDTGLNTVFANVFSATKCLFLNQIEEARERAETALECAERMQFKQWIAQSKIQMARIRDLSGDPSALAAMQQALSDYLATGMVLARPYAQVWIAEAMIRQGQSKAALAELDDLQRFMDTSMERYFLKRANEARARASRSLNTAPASAAPGR